MECSFFRVNAVGDLMCANPPRSWVKVGTVHEVPPGLSEGQLLQVRAWKAFAPLAYSLAPVFSVTTYGPEHIEAGVRFRVPPGAVETTRRLKASLHKLVEDLREAGHYAVLDMTYLIEPTGTEMTVWKVALQANPTEEDPAKLQPGLELVAEAVQMTRIGDHVMDPEEEWLPRRKGDLGRRSRKN